jgi:magnesium transporter
MVNFAVLFHTGDKSCERVSAEAISPDVLSSSDFAWCDFDFASKEEARALLTEFGFTRPELETALDAEDPFFFSHRQRRVLDLFHVCHWEDQGLKTTPLIVAMTNRIIVTVHQGPSMYVDRVLETCEESFRSVGKSPGFIYFLFWDAMVDAFLPHVFYIDNRLEQLEDAYMNGNSGKEVLDDILGAKHMVRLLKQSLSPMQRCMRHLVATRLEIIRDEARAYLNGIFEHADRIGQTVDSLQERVHATMSGYDSVLSQQINKSMKVLAIIATIMMPLSLLAGIYGTNFEYMPELHWRYSYFVFLGVMFGSGLGLLVLFKKKKWL